MAWISEMHISQSFSDILDAKKLQMTNESSAGSVPSGEYTKNQKRITQTLVLFCWFIM